MKTNFNEIIEKGEILAHTFSTTTGNNYDVVLVRYNNEIYIINHKTGERGTWDELNEFYEFDINNQPSYRFNRKDLLQIKI
jgi:hypothetical protein